MNFMKRILVFGLTTPRLLGSLGQSTFTQWDNTSMGLKQLLDHEWFVFEKLETLPTRHELHWAEHPCGTSIDYNLFTAANSP